MGKWCTSEAEPSLGLIETNHTSLLVVSAIVFWFGGCKRQSRSGESSDALADRGACRVLAERVSGNIPIERSLAFTLCMKGHKAFRGAVTQQKLDAPGSPFQGRIFLQFPSALPSKEIVNSMSVVGDAAQALEMTFHFRLFRSWPEARSIQKADSRGYVEFLRVRPPDRVYFQTSDGSVSTTDVVDFQVVEILPILLKEVERKSRQARSQNPRFEQPPNLSAPTARERLRVGNECHEGGLGVVCFGELDGASVAYKAILPSKVPDAGLRKEIIQAHLDFVPALRSLPGYCQNQFIKIHDVWIDSRGGSAASTGHIIMERAKGDGYLLSPQLSPRSSKASWNLELLEGFAHLATCLKELSVREPPFTHNDIKPANMLVTQDGSLALSDYDSASPRFIEPGVMTDGYAAPERLLQPGRTLTADADYYSLAMSFVEIITGRDPIDFLQMMRVTPPQDGDWRPALRRIYENPSLYARYLGEVQKRLNASGTAFASPGAGAPALGDVLLGGLSVTPADRTKALRAFLNSRPASHAKSVLDQFAKLVRRAAADVNL